jgi:hypothetical protein
MEPSADVYKLRRQNRLLKQKLADQTERFESERSRLLERRRFLESLIGQEQRRHRELAAEFERRMGRLESELHRVQLPAPRVSPGSTALSFSVLELEANRLQEETDRICGLSNRPLSFSPRVRPAASPERVLENPASPPPAKEQTAPPPGLAPAPAEPDPAQGPREEPPEQLPFPNLAPAREFVAAPVSAESSINDDFFENAAPSPELSRQGSGESQAPPMERHPEPPKANAKPRQRPRTQSSASSDPFGALEVSFDLQLNESPPKQEPAKKKAAQPSKARQQPVKEKTSAETFEIDPDQIKFDFSGIDPFG